MSERDDSGQPRRHGGSDPPTKTDRPAPDGRECDSWLRLHAGSQEFIVGGGRPFLRFGRRIDNDLVIGDEFVSRYHGAIARRDLGFVLIDASANGTFVLRRSRAATYAHNETVLLEGAGALRLGRPDGTMLTYLIEPTSGDAHRARAPTIRNVFRQEGEFWSIEYNGTIIRIEDRKGLHLIAYLLRHPGEEFYVLDLALLRTGVSPIGAAEWQQSLLADGVTEMNARSSASGGADSAGAADRRRPNAMRARRAPREPDPGTSRMAERARVMVTVRIKAALRDVRERHPVLGRHLDISIRTGRFCRYMPDHPVFWNC